MWPVQHLMGAFLPLATRGAENEPLTLIQLSAQIWQDVCKMSRADVISVLARVQLPIHLDQTTHTVHSDFLSWLQTYLHFLSHSKTAFINLDNESDGKEHAAEKEDSILEESDITGGGDSHMDDGQDTTCTMAAESVEVMTTSEMDAVLHDLQHHPKANIAKAWQGKNHADLISAVQTSKSLNKLRVPELNVLIKHTKLKQQASGDILKCSEMSKSDKVSALSKLLGDGSIDEAENIVSAVHELRTLAGNILLRKARYRKSPSKDVLNVTLAKAVYPHERKDWELKGTVQNVHLVVDTEDGRKKWKPEFWFSYPEFSARREQLEPKCCDSHHLLVNCRVKVCKSGLPGFGISNDAWIKVADSYPEVISRALVVDIIDKQSNAYAQKVFGEPVQEALMKLGFSEEAKFCRLLRNWYSAEDEPGICSAERVQHRVAFREYLLSKADLTRFPPYGMYVSGMPRQMYEGFLQNIDTHLQLFAVVKGGAYNPRSVTSLANETFFGEMSELEQTKLGCPKAIHVPRLIAGVTEVLHYRHNPQAR